MLQNLECVCGRQNRSYLGTFKQMQTTTKPTPIQNTENMMIKFIVGKVMFAALLSLAFVDISSGVVTCGGNGFDLSPLKGQEFSISSGGYNYNLNVCSETEQKCPNDPKGFTKGMLVQTKPNGLLEMKCYVIAVFNKNSEKEWSQYENGETLTLANGATNECPDGAARTLKANFICSLQPTPNDGQFIITNEPGTCDYTLEFPTCYACSGGCGSRVSLGFFGSFFWGFLIVVATYVACGCIHEYNMGKRGCKMLPNSAFWSTFAGYVRDGFFFAFCGVCNGRVESDGLLKADGLLYTAGLTSEESYQKQ